MTNPRHSSRPAGPAIVLTPAFFGRWLVIAGAFFAPLNMVRPVPGGPATLSDLLLFVGFVLLIPTMLGRRIVLPVPLVLGSAAIVVMTLVTSLLGGLGPGLSLGARFVVAAVGIPLAFACWRPSSRTLEQLSWAYVAGAVVNTGAALMQGPIDNGRYEGLTNHPNFFALGATTGLALLLYLLGRGNGLRSVLRLLAVGVAGTACVLGALLSGSRTALLTVVVLAVAFPIIERSLAAVYVLGWFLAGGLVFGGRILAAQGGGSALVRLGGDPTAQTSDSLRRDLLVQAVGDIAHRPLTGDAYAHALLAQNVYLQVWVSIGVLGLVGFLLILWTCGRPLFSAARDRRLGYVALAYAFECLLTASMWDRFVWVGLAIALVAGLPEDPPGATSVPESPDSVPIPWENR